MTKVVVLTEIDSPSRMIFSDRWTAKSASSFFSNSTKIDAAPHKTQATGLRLFIGLKDYEIRVRVGISESIFDGGVESTAPLTELSAASPANLDEDNVSNFFEQFLHVLYANVRVSFPPLRLVHTEKHKQKNELTGLLFSNPKI